MAGRLDALATGLYAHVRPERLPYDSPLSQHFAKTRRLGERTEKLDAQCWIVNAAEKYLEDRQ